MTPGYATHARAWCARAGDPEPRRLPAAGGRPHGRGRERQQWQRLGWWHSHQHPAPNSHAIWIDRANSDPGAQSSTALAFNESPLPDGNVGTGYANFITVLLSPQEHS